jgi:MFS transporter, CP family, cyanate transporter
MRSLADSRRAAYPGFVLTVVGMMLVGFNGRIAVTSVPPLLASLGLGGAAQSLLVTLPIICFAAGATAGPRLRRLLGEEKAIFLLVALMIVAIVVRGAFPSFALFPATLVIALSIAVLNVHIPSLVKRRFPDRPGVTMALYTSAFLIGAGVAAWLAVPAKDLFGGSVRMGLAIWALPAVIALIAWLPQLRFAKSAGTRIAGAGLDNDEAIALAAMGAATDEAEVAPEAAGTSDTCGKPRTSVWRNLLAWEVTVFMGTSSLIFFGTFSWLPQIDAGRGISTSTTGYVLLLATVFGVFGSLGAPALARRLPDQRPAVVISCLIQIAGFLCLMVAPPSAAFVWAALFGIGNGATLSLSYLLIVLRSADEHVAARLSSMAQCGGYLIAAAGPLLSGLLHTLTGSWTASTWFLIVAGVACLASGFPAGYDRVVGGAGSEERKQKAVMARQG